MSEVKRVSVPPPPPPEDQVVVTLSMTEAGYLAAYLDVILWSSIQNLDARNFIMEFAAKLDPVTGYTTCEAYFEGVALHD